MSVGSLPKNHGALPLRVLTAVRYYRQLLKAETQVVNTRARMQDMLDDLDTTEFELWKEATLWMGS